MLYLLSETRNTFSIDWALSLGLDAQRSSIVGPTNIYVSMWAETHKAVAD